MKNAIASTSSIFKQLVFDMKYPPPPPSCHFSNACRVLAKKEVSLLRSSLSHSPFFTKDLEQNFLSPVLSNTLNFLATKLHVYKIVDAVHRKRTHYTVNTCSKQDFISSTLLAIVALILKVARNSFQTFHFITLDGSMWFRYQMTMCVT